MDRDQSGGTGNGDLGAHFLQQIDIAQGHPGMHDIADDGDLFSFQSAQLLPDREGIQQGLGGVFVDAVSGVDDGCGECVLTGNGGLRWRYAA